MLPQTSELPQSQTKEASTTRSRDPQYAACRLERSSGDGPGISTLRAKRVIARVGLMVLRTEPLRKSIPLEPLSGLMLILSPSSMGKVGGFFLLIFCFLQVPKAAANLSVPFRAALSRFNFFFKKKKKKISQVLKNITKLSVP